MALVIYNPTDFEITCKWDSLDHVFKAGEKKKYEDGPGRAIYHNYEKRGLVILEYGDEGEIEIKKAEEGRKKCDDFWTEQVVRYNQLNESRQQSNMSFLKPADEILFHAKRLGIRMLEPYRLEDASSKQISLLMEQNQDLRKEIDKKDTALSSLQTQMNELTSNFKQLMALAGQVPKEKAAATVDGDNGNQNLDPKSLKASYRKMGKKQFFGWLTKNWDEIQSYPAEVVKHIGEKHVNLYGTELPDEIPAIENYELA